MASSDAAAGIQKDVVPEGCAAAGGSAVLLEPSQKWSHAPPAPHAEEPSITVAPLHMDQRNAHRLRRYAVVREGKGAILFKDNAVFYNQAQVRVLLRLRSHS